MQLVFFETSKKFDEIWREDLLLRLKQNRISSNLINILEQNKTEPNMDGHAFN